MSRKYRLPSKAHQAATVLAFRRIALNQKTQEGLPWTPSRILEEMWELWDDRPDGLFEKSNFIEAGTANYQKIERLKSGRTSSLKKDARLFHLVEKFVRKHTPKGDYVVPGEDIYLINKTAERLLWFSHSQEKPVFTNLYLDTFSTPLMEKFGIIVIEIDKDKESDKRKIGRKLVSIRLPKTGDPDFVTYAWPASLIYQEHLYCEIGFYIPNTNSLFLRSISNLANPEYEVSDSVWLKDSFPDTGRDPNYHNLRLSFGVGGEILLDDRDIPIFDIMDVLRRKVDVNTIPKPNLHLAADVMDVVSNKNCVADIGQNESYYSLCSKLLKLLDNSDSKDHL